jgi:hypothetical protein
LPVERACLTMQAGPLASQSSWAYLRSFFLLQLLFLSIVGNVEQLSKTVRIKIPSGAALHLRIESKAHPRKTVNQKRSLSREWNRWVLFTTFVCLASSGSRFTVFGIPGSRFSVLGSSGLP